MGRFSISCLLKNVEDGIQWVFSGVYDPNDDTIKMGLWEESKEVRFQWKETCVWQGILMSYTTQVRD